MAMPAREIPVTLVCAGNRRKEENLVKQTIGFNWGAAGLGTSVWKGVLLRDVLLRCVAPRAAPSSRRLAPPRRPAAAPPIPVTPAAPPPRLPDTAAAPRVAGAASRLPRRARTTCASWAPR